MSERTTASCPVTGCYVSGPHTHEATTAGPMTFTMGTSDQDPKPTEEDGWPTGWPTAAMRPSDWWFGLYGKRHYESDNCPDPCFDCAALVHYAREILKTHAAAHAAARAEGERAGAEKRGAEAERRDIVEKAREWARNRSMRAAALERETPLADLADDLNREARVLRDFAEIIEAGAHTPEKGESR